MFWIALLLSLLPTTLSVQCISSQGNPVDWYIVYKLPMISNSKYPILKEGYGHFYMDVNTPTWQLSKISMNDSHHAVAYTLQPVFHSQKSEDFMYVMYNDEDPNKKEPRDVGHSKGVLAFDKQTGFWLVHSTPRFPDFQNKGYSWPHTAVRYGQSFLCISLKYSMLNNIAKQIAYNFVQVYDKWSPESFLSDNPYLANVINHEPVSSSSVKSLVFLTSIQGTQFTSFAKTYKFADELYKAWVAPTLKSDLLTETWLNGRGVLPSNCTGTYKVYNVKTVSLPDNISFKDSKDHSKWAISKDRNNWVCIGDINREKHQMYRGGGTVCIQNSQIWNQFSRAVAKYEQC